MFLQVCLAVPAVSDAAPQSDFLIRRHSFREEDIRHLIRQVFWLPDQPTDTPSRRQAGGFQTPSRVAVEKQNPQCRIDLVINLPGFGLCVSSSRLQRRDRDRIPTWAGHCLPFSAVAEL